MFDQALAEYDFPMATAETHHTDNLFDIYFSSEKNLFYRYLNRVINKELYWKIIYYTLTHPRFQDSSYFISGPEGKIPLALTLTQTCYYLEYTTHF